MPEKVQKTPLLKDGTFTVDQVKELAFFDLTGEKAKTVGTSNKSYHIELHVGKDDKCQLYTIWGSTGASTQTKEWRYYTTKTAAQKDFDVIVKSKTKKGYKEIDVAQRAQGSDAAKAIVKAVILKGADAIAPVIPCNLPEPTQHLIAHLFGATSQFVATTLKCPLGQLSNNQIDQGRKCLDDAKAILNTVSNKLSKKELTSLQDLTNDFYGLIPHNLGQGSRGQMTHLLFDDITKVVQKESDLDTLWDAKSVGAVLNNNSGLDAQYKELNADLTWIDSADPLFKFMSSYFSKSKVRGHGYASAKVKNLWKMERKDKESDFFLENCGRIAKDCGKHVFIQETKNLGHNPELHVPDRRPDLNSIEKELFNKANVWLCWHGTRSANVVGITKRGLMIRPAGAVITGAMFGSGKYYAHQSTKSLNYTDGGYWTGGRSQNSSRFMFLLDVTLGNMFIAPHSHYYHSAPKGFHSVYGKAHNSGVMNDEMITYDYTQKDVQGRIKYLLEISDS